MSDERLTLSDRVEEYVNRHFGGDASIAEVVDVVLPALGYAIVPLEGEGFRAAVKRAVDRHNREPRGHVWTHVSRMTEALRAALTPGDDTNG